MGMKKDFILSEEEKQRRKKRLDENRNLASQRLTNSESISQAMDEIDPVSFYTKKKFSLLFFFSEINGYK
jgi:hypothetical protein